MNADCSTTNQRSRRWLTGASLVVLLSLQGCGDSGGVISSPAPTPTPVPTPTPTPTPATSFDTSEYRRSTGPSQHNVIPAWQLGATGAGVTIGIVDSGIDTTNPEFAGRISAASADVAGTRGLFNPDSNHGTQVALTAAAARDGTGIVGIAFGATILAARADDPGSCATTRMNNSGGCSFFDSKIAAGIDAAVAGGAKVINISLGGSPPNQTVINSVARAAAAGIVIVVSAGNDGTSSTTNPDTFAIGLRAAGNGNVIIAGSVDSANKISSFSNEAGTEQQWYLSALGDRVCCVYENGVIKVTTTNGQNFVTVVSGTSFSAPQISGAVALVRQYFPNLSAVQVVDLLLRTATDLGAAGTDTVYGRGTLNIAAAFSPQGTTSLADNSTALVPIGSTAISTSAAMGDASRTKALQAVVLDSYQRAYNATFGLSSAGFAPRLSGALTGGGRNLSARAGGMALSFAVGDASHLRGAGPQGRLQLSPGDARVASVLAAKAIGRLSPKASFGIAFGMGADGMVAQLQGKQTPVFLISGDPASDLGFSHQGYSALASRYALGRWGLTVSAENGRVIQSGADELSRSITGARNADHFVRVGAALDRHFGALETSLGASWLDERRSVLGARIAPGLGAKGATSMFFDAGAALPLGKSWRLAANWRQGWTSPRVAGTLTSGSRLSENAWAFDVSRSGVFQNADSIALRISQPMRVNGGGINFLLPVAYSYDTLSATQGVSAISLTPRGREIDREIAWHGLVAGGGVTASLFWRTDPGHYADLRDDIGLGFSWTKGF